MIKWVEENTIYIKETINHVTHNVTQHSKYMVSHMWVQSATQKFWGCLATGGRDESGKMGI